MPRIETRHFQNTSTTLMYFFLNGMTPCEAWQTERDLAHTVATWLATSFFVSNALIASNYTILLHYI